LAVISSDLPVQFSYRNYLNLIVKQQMKIKSIEAMIVMANLVPRHVEMPNLADMFVEEVFESEHREHVDVPFIIRRAFRGYPNAQAFIEEQWHTLDPQTISHFLSIYSHLVNVRHLVVQVAALSATYREHLGSGALRSSYVTRVSVPVYLTIPKEDIGSKTPHVVTHSLIEPLLGIDVARIRSCVICENIFWARRSNAETCQKACSDRLGNLKRKGQTRQRNPESDSMAHRLARQRRFES
jgi:hypothetical protein